MENTTEWFKNKEDSENIVCPYCGHESIATYEAAERYGHSPYARMCGRCGKIYKVSAYRAGWRFLTETIDGEVTEYNHRLMISRLVRERYEIERKLRNLEEPKPLIIEEDDGFYDMIDKILKGYERGLEER